MNEIFPLASAAGMTVGLAVCALIIGLVLAMLFAVWSQRNGVPSPGQAPRWSPCCAATGNSGGPVYLFRLLTAAATLSDGFTINLGFAQIPVQMQIENFDVSPFLCGVIALSCSTPPTRRKPCAAR
jgi:arginine transport system permease protein